MVTIDVELPGIAGPGLLREPRGDRPPRGGVVALHGASRGEREQPLFDHLARTLVPLGYAVLSYDRRPRVAGADVPLTEQSDDARSAAAFLERRLDDEVGGAQQLDGAHHEQRRVAAAGADERHGAGRPLRRPAAGALGLGHVRTPIRSAAPRSSSSAASRRPTSAASDVGPVAERRTASVPSTAATRPRR